MSWMLKMVYQKLPSLTLSIISQALITYLSANLKIIAIFPILMVIRSTD